MVFVLPGRRVAKGVSQARRDDAGHSPCG
jgi:hypothetical protein